MHPNKQFCCLLFSDTYSAMFMLNSGWLWWVLIPLNLFWSWPEAADDACSPSSTSSTSPSPSASHGAPSALAGPSPSACSSAYPAPGCCTSGGCSHLLTWSGCATLLWGVTGLWMSSCRSQKWSPWCPTHLQYRGPSLPSNPLHQSFRLHPRCTLPPLPPLPPWDSNDSTSGFRDPVEWYVCFDWECRLFVLWWMLFALCISGVTVFPEVRGHISAAYPGKRCSVEVGWCSACVLLFHSALLIWCLSVDHSGRASSTHPRTAHRSVRQEGRGGDHRRQGTQQAWAGAPPRWGKSASHISASILFSL